MNEMANFKCSKFASSPVSNLALQKKQKNCKKTHAGDLLQLMLLFHIKA